MEHLRQIGIELERRWQGEPFAELATAVLRDAGAHEPFSVEELFRWFRDAGDVPAQPANLRFGEPPILVYAAEKFYVEVLFWLDGTTAIHQHGFSGAFQVLAGSSIHTRHTFAATEAVTPALVLGELRAETPELLRRGDVRAIESGDRLIHSLFHLDRPSATLVVRTRRDEGCARQLSYLRGGIAHDPFHDEERLDRLLRLFGVLRQTDAALAGRELRALAATADLHTVATVLFAWFRSMPFERGDGDELLAIVAGRHAALARALRSALAELRRQALIVERRKTLHDPRHRFLLALLLNVRGRERILELVEAQYPGRPARERVGDWIGEMACYDLGEVELRVFRELLAQKNVDEIVSALADEFDVDGQAGEIAALCEALRGSALFQTLLGEAA